MTVTPAMKSRSVKSLPVPRVIMYYNRHLPSGAFPFDFCSHSPSLLKETLKGPGKVQQSPNSLLSGQTL